ncbi:MAG TPA: response regulator transcription factor [Dissulfurispiraceae bacterium]|nr:response regulator transcription factor [Dissulfurispiraceae bacterium]
MKVKVLLAEDHRVMRDGLKSLLEQQTDITIAGVADNGRIAVQMAQELMPNVVVMDIAMPELNGIEATRQIMAKCRDAKVLILSMHADSHFISGAVEAGASGYLMKDCSFDELLSAIRSLAQGKNYFSSEVAGNIISEYIGGNINDPVERGRLSSREREVLQLLAEGKSSAQIAVVLGVHERTVDVHRHKIMKKLDRHNVAELTKYAVREGLTSL